MSKLAAPLVALLDAVAPVRCAGCGAWDEHLCRECRMRMDSLARPPVAAGVVAAFPYAEPVSRIVQAAKFGDCRTALRQAAALAASRMAAPGRGAVLIPIALGRRRRRQRGYNQAETIAAELARQWGLHLHDGLVRRRETGPQMGRSSAARETNIRGAFAWTGSSLAGTTAILVDDVSTTGATLRAAAEAVREAGSGPIGGAVLARKL